MKKKERLADISLLLEPAMEENASGCKIDVENFCKRLSQLAEKHGIEGGLYSFLEQIGTKKNNELFIKDISSHEFAFKNEIENEFFKCLLGGIREGDVVTKYTSFDNLSRICLNNEVGMTSLVGMNDSTECFYTDNYLKSLGYDMHLPQTYNYKVGTSAYITSFTTLRDNLTMWRLYADDARGIAIDYKVNENLKGDFIMAKVSYAESTGTHKELDFLANLHKIIDDGCNFVFHDLMTWRYFFKPYHYAVEKEVRLLHFPSNGKPTTWIKTGAGIIAPLMSFTAEDRSTSVDENKHILYPLSICGVMLGPRFTEAEANRGSIQIMLEKCLALTNNDVYVNLSSIDNYRHQQN